MTDIDLPIVTHYSLIGGSPAIDSLVESFYRRVDSLPEAATIRAMHAADLSETKAVLKRYLTEWLGGPLLYSEKRGHPRLRQRHIRFPIGPAERDAWMLCMRGALKETIADAGIRKQIEERLYKLADWVRNDEANPHDATQGHCSRHA